MSSYWFRLLFIPFVLVFFFGLRLGTPAQAMTYYDYVKIGITPIPCQGSGYNPLNNTAVIACPSTPENFSEFYGQTDAQGNGSDVYVSDPDKEDTTADPISGATLNTRLRRPPYNMLVPEIPDRPQTTRYDVGPHLCATYYNRDPTITYPDAGLVFTDNPQQYHYWVEDPDVTALGKSLERSRQFLYWAVTRPAVDESPVLKQIWGVSRNVAYSIVILMASVLGLAYIVSGRLKWQYKDEFNIWSTVLKIGSSLLFIALSAAVVLTLVQLSEILMKFFIETLGGDRLFNTYFGQVSSEANYVTFVGCRDLNIRMHEAAQAQEFIIRATNVSYYVMGVMIILRKILLWFLLFVAPFLPILLSFPLLRNTGRIWIGVFFQWLFYGPLLALFLGATALIWDNGIPYLFDFSRIRSSLGYVFPTALILTYGGPAQRGNSQFGPLNNGNYVDTFAEYLISLLMVWAVTFFPWWLLRIFRDNCCEGIYSMRGALLNFLDGLKTPPVIPPPGPTTPPPPARFDTPPIRTMPSSTRETSVSTIRLDNYNAVRQANTHEIVRAMSIQAKTLRDVARLETSKESVRTAKESLAFLQNPLAAQTASVRQQYLNLRTELFNRATSKNDEVARSILAVTAVTSQENITRKTEMARSVESVISKMNEQGIASLTQAVSQASQLPQEKVVNITNSTINNIVHNDSVVQSIAQSSRTNSETVRQVLESYTRHISQPVDRVVQSISQTTNVSTESVKSVLEQTKSIVERAATLQRIADTVRITEHKTNEILKQIETVTSAAPEVQYETQFTAHDVSNIASTVIQRASQDSTLMSRLAESTRLSREQVSHILSSISTSQDTNVSQLVEHVSTSTNVDKEKISELIRESAKTTGTYGSRTPLYSQITQEQSQRVLQEIQLATGLQTPRTTLLFTSPTIEEHLLQSIHSLSETIINQSERDREVVNEIATRTNLSHDQVRSVLQTLATCQERGSETILQAVSAASNISPPKVEEVLRQSVYVAKEKQLSVKELETLAKQVTVVERLDKETVNNMAREVVSFATTNSAILEKVATITRTPASVIATVYASLQQATDVTDARIYDRISQTTNLSKEKIIDIIRETISQVDEAKQHLALAQAFSQPEAKSMISGILAHAAQDMPVVHEIQQQTGLSRKQVETILTTFAKEADITSESLFADLQRDVGVNKLKALAVVRQAIQQTKAAKDLVTPTPSDKLGENTKVLQEQLEAAVNPESQIEQFVPLPEDQSLDEYEEIRELWVHQYEEGEVPISEVIHTRLDWINQDITIMTNILNKLLSKDEKMRRQALEEIGFILPIFMINNLTGAQLLTYLKAKLSAAKQVKKDLQRRQAELPAQEEELVEVDRRAGAVDENTQHLAVPESESDETGNKTTNPASDSPEARSLIDEESSQIKQ
jgi:hypothetical protein